MTGAYRKKIENAMKRELCQFSEDNRNLSQLQVAAYFQKKWKRVLPKSTVSNIIIHKAKWLDASNVGESPPPQAETASPPQLNRGHRNADLAEVEQQLYLWCEMQKSHNLPFNDAILVNKAKEFGDELGIGPNFRYSMNWLTTFKLRHHIDDNLNDEDEHLNKSQDDYNHDQQDFDSLNSADLKQLAYSYDEFIDTDPADDHLSENEESFNNKEDIIVHTNNNRSHISNHKDRHDDLIEQPFITSRVALDSLNSLKLYFEQQTNSTLDDFESLKKLSDKILANIENKKRQQSLFQSSFNK